VWLSLVIAKLLRVHFVYWTEGIKEPTSLLGRISRPLRILFIKASASIIVPGRLSRSYILSLGAKTEKVFIAPNSIDNKLFAELSIKDSERRNQIKADFSFKDKIVILFVGQLNERKGIRYLFHAYSKIEKDNDNIALLVVGDGPLETVLQSLAKSLGIRRLKMFHSGLSLEELIMLYSISDVFVLPTLEDIWGFVINEAMICGLPVISTYASQAAIEMIHSGENGYIIKEADSEELYFALKTLVYDSKKRKDMGEKARETVMREFDICNMVNGFRSAIRFTFLRKPTK
jgi:glycosyltransferase involved in cell wall biosynthesis